MSTKEPGPHRLRVEKPSGSKTQVNIVDGALIACDLGVELAYVVFKATDPTKLLGMMVTSLFLGLTDEFRKFLNEVPNLCHAGIGERGMDHANDGRGEGAQVVVGPRWSIQQKLLGGGGGFSRLSCSMHQVDDFFSGGIEFGVSGTISSQGVSATRD